MANTSDEQREKEKKVSQAAAQAQSKQPSGCLIGGIVFVVLGGIFGSAVSTGGAFLILGLAVVVGIIVAVSNSNKTETAVVQATKTVESVQDRRRREMESVFSSAKQSGFIFSKKVVNVSNTACLALDSTHEKFLVKDESFWRVLSYKQLISYDLCKDGSSVITGDASGAIVGGLLFGTVGAIAGAAGSSKSVNNYCSDMYISIVDNTANRYKIPLIKEPVLESSLDYKVAIERAREMISILSVIDNSNKNQSLAEPSNQFRSATPALSTRNSSSLNDTNFEAIKKYKELLEMGIITQAEFDAKKAELLGIGGAKQAPTISKQTTTTPSTIKVLPKVMIDVRNVMKELEGLDRTDKLAFLSEALSEDKITSDQYDEIIKTLNL